MFVAFGLRSVVLFDAAQPFVPPQFGIKLADEPWERDAHFRLRRRVFCDEQQLFEESDRDDADAIASPIVAVDYVMAMAHRVVGTVRIHEGAPGLWYGSRLAIDAPYRMIYGLGSGLVHRAVRTANAHGCHTFLANIQRQNVAFFRRLAWEPLQELEVLGHPHTLMRADLASYPPYADDAQVSVVHTRLAS